MKKVLISLVLLSICGTLFAQQKRDRGGFYLGADRDTLQYIIASPFDNWYVGAGIGLQTFRGNELEASARHNGLNHQFYAEVGKWLIPDISVALHLKYFDVSGQTKYGLHPFVDFNDVSAMGENGYFPFHAHAFTLGGLVAMDWTNLFSGYESGLKQRLHIITPIGLGGSMLFGLQKADKKSHHAGDFRRNFELYFTAGITFEYRVSKFLCVDATANIMGSESTWDWSPYDNSYSIFDVMPSVTVGARINLLKTVTKVDAKTGKKLRADVNHVFIPASNERIVLLQRRIDTLRHEMQLLSDGADADAAQKAAELAKLTNQIDSIQSLLSQGKGNPNDLRWQIQQLQYEIARINDMDTVPQLTMTTQDIDDLINRQKAREEQLQELDNQIVARQRQLEYAKDHHPEQVAEIADEIERLLGERKSIVDAADQDNRRSGITNPDGKLTPYQAAVLAREASSRILALNSLNHQIDSLQNLLRRETSDPMAELSDAIDRLELPMARVYFKLDKYDLDANARSIIHQFALQVKRGPQDVKYYLIGAADAQTGTAPHNVWLSKNRCQVVYDVLTRSYGISPDQLEMFPLGGITEYSPKEYNRTCLLVLSNNELVEIIDKWKSKK